MADELEIVSSKVPGKNKKLVRGARLRKYRLAGLLGKGGSSEVWKARDCVEGIWVALKIPLLETSGERDNKAMLKEIRLVARLRHEHIMPIKNADIINGHVVLATELSAGTLEDRSRPMSVKRVISIISQVLEGLAYAHRRKLAHCDVTPGNIFFLPDKRAALGDFGISMQIKGRIVTSDVYGTPGYIAPEQAYGKPTFRSDCFAVALILYEYITGFLPRWPFRWPLRGNKRLKARTSLEFTKFMRKALSVDPEKRFANAGLMLDALRVATPKKFRTAGHQKSTHRRSDWKKVRQQAYLKKYEKVLGAAFECTKCGEPITEAMQICPWCGTERNLFDSRSTFERVCPDCHKGVLPEWRYCPWCYGPGFDSPSETKSTGVRYHGKCRHCGGKLMRFMVYCPWCQRKVQRPWRVSAFGEICSKCHGPVDTDFWIHCPWCTQQLI